MKIRKSISRTLTMIAGILALVGIAMTMGSVGALQQDTITCLQCATKSLKAFIFIATALGVGLLKDSFDRKFINNFYKNR